MPTYPSLNPLFCPQWEYGVNVAFGEGEVSSFPDKQSYHKKILRISIFKYKILGIRLPTPPLIQHFAFREKLVITLDYLGEGGGGWALYESLKLIWKIFAFER